MKQNVDKPNEIKTAIINGKFTICASIISAIATLIVGFFGGQIKEEKNVNNSIISAINITGDNNEVVINDVESLIQNYLQLKLEHEELQKQKDDSASELAQLTEDINQAYILMNSKEEQANKEIDNLKMQLNDSPSINYRNLGLCIDVEDIPINIDKSFVAIDGHEYFSREIVDKLLPDDKIMTINDDTIFIGPVIANKAKLTDQYIKTNSYCELRESAKDSFGYIHTDCIIFSGYYGSSEIEFSLQNKYNKLKCNLSIYGNNNEVATVNIKRDGEIIESYEITKDTETIPINDLPINKCSVLTITKSGGFRFSCIISDAIVYN